MKAVSMKFYRALDAAVTTDEQVGVGHAKVGYPVEVLIHRGTNSQRLHLTVDELRSIMEQGRTILLRETGIV